MINFEFSVNFRILEAHYQLQVSINGRHVYRYSMEDLYTHMELGNKHMKKKSALNCSSVGGHLFMMECSIFSVDVGACDGI